MIISGLAVTAGTVITAENPDGYIISGDNLFPQNTNETNTTLRADISEIDQIYDGVLVYWNITNTETGEETRGPATFTQEPAEVKATERGLEPNTEYNTQAYAEPVVWDDDTLFDNFVE